MLPQAAWLIAVFAPTVLGTKILLTNGDGWAVSIIRAQFEALTRSGYDVILSAPADNKSGTSSNTTTPTPRTSPCEFDACPTGSPAEGFNATDPRFNYVNGYPVDAVKYGIQTLSPKLFGGPPDLVVSGPSVGLNTGPIVNISGTVGAAVEAAREGLLAIAISADGDSTAQIPYTTLTSEPNSNLTKSAEVYSNLTMKFLTEFLKYGVLELLPENTILNVNYPGTAHCPTVDSFKFVFTRMNEDAAVHDIKMCGSDHLPTENTAIGSGCYVSVSVVNATNKADVSARVQVQVWNRLLPIFSCLPLP